MIKFFTKKTVTTTENITLQISEKQFKEEIYDNENFAQYCRNVEKFASDNTGKDDLKIVDVRYKDDDMDSGVIEIETERTEVVVL